MNDTNLPAPWQQVPIDEGFTPAPAASYGDTPLQNGANESLLGLALSLLALARRNWLLVSVSTAAVLGVAMYRLKQERPIYQAAAVIRIADRSPLKDGAGSNTVAAGVANGSVLLSQIQILQSRAVAREVASQSGLRLQTSDRALPSGIIRDAEVPDAAPNGIVQLRFMPQGVDASGLGERTRAAYGSPMSLHGVRFTVASRPANLEESRLELVPLDVAVQDVLSRLRGVARSNTDIIDVQYQDYDDYRAQRVVNAAVEAFQSMDARAAKQESSRRREFIEQQLQRIEVLLNEAEMVHNRFQSEQQVASVQGKSAVGRSSADLAGIATRRDELQAEQSALKNFLDSNTTTIGIAGRDRLARLMATPSLAPSPAVAEAYGQLSRLRVSRDSMTVGPYARAAQDPDVRRLDVLIASADSALVRSLHAQAAALDMRLSVLDDLRQRTLAEIATRPAAQVQETSLTAQVESYQHQAEALRTQLQAAQIDEAAQAGQVEIVDLASSHSRLLSTQRLPKISLAILLGLALGMMFGYVIENHSPVIRRRDEVERIVPLPNLAMVPQIRRAKQVRKRLRASAQNDAKYDPAMVTATSELVTFSNGRSTGAEAYRTLRTNLLFSSAVSSLHRIVVTSAGPREGKSTTSANLAIAFAQQGYRVLLVDGDFRRPRLHKMFRRSLQPGVTDILVHKTTPTDAIQRTPDERLFILTAGTMPPNPAELLGSPQMKSLLDELSETFNMVIIDTPPLLAASDAAILGRVADGTLLVVRAGKTQRAAVIEGMSQLERVGARVLGTVLNDPDAEVAKYAPYYQYYYNNYYDYSTSDS